MSTHNYSRRDFLKTTSMQLGTLALAGNLFAQNIKSKPPNILIIHVDENRYDCLGAYDNGDIKTPHIDQLATDGVRYVNSYCPFPVCTPSRYSLLTGQYVHQHGGLDNHSTLASKIDTFPKILRAFGYKTKAVGKMHFTPTYLDVGFDEMILCEQNGPGRWDDDYHRYLMKHDLVDRNDLEDQRSEYRRHAPSKYWDTCGALVSNLPEKHHLTTWIAEKAIADLKTWSKNSQHLLMIGFVKPHHPFDPPAPWHEMYDPQKLNLLPGWTEECFEHDLYFSGGYFPHDQLTEAKMRRVMAYYYATISQIDHHVGRMIELLKQKDLYDNTMILFTSDHGDYMGYHHLLLKGGYMYDPTVKVPLIIKWPGNINSGTLSQRMVQNIDLAPTICSVAGCRSGVNMSGLNLMQQNNGHELIFAEAGKRHVMARSENYKLILNNNPRGKNQFYDLKKDPLEKNNLYDSYTCQPQIKEMTESLHAWRPPNSPYQKFLDEGAPQIKQPNVPSYDRSHRPAVIEYFRKKC